MVEGPETRQDIWIASRTDPGKPSRVLASAAREIHLEISPDGRWIAYTSDEENPSNEVYVDLV
jgi:Tol biopolymer transport system component